MSRKMIDLTTKDIVFIENACLKSGNAELLEKVIEIKDYVHFHRLDGITLDMDWRRDRKEELK